VFYYVNVCINDLLCRDGPVRGGAHASLDEIRKYSHVMSAYVAIRIRTYIVCMYACMYACMCACGPDL
jgi:hypothetical protein